MSAQRPWPSLGEGAVDPTERAATGDLAGDFAGEWPPVEREALAQRARDYARGSRAESTWRAYERRWARFQAWCVEHGEWSYPADPRTVCRFLVTLAPEWRPATPADPDSAIVAGHVLVRPGVRPDTVAAYLAAISVAHQGTDYDDLTKGPSTSGHDAASAVTVTAAPAPPVANPLDTLWSDACWPGSAGTPPWPRSGGGTRYARPTWKPFWAGSTPRRGWLMPATPRSC